MMLGDFVERALRQIGIDKAGVEKWLGGPCGCDERKWKLNALGAWAARIIEGRTDRAEEYLKRITGEEAAK